MDTNDMILVSVDDHVIEPPTMFDAHIPEKYRDQAPKIMEQYNAKGVDFSVVVKDNQVIIRAKPKP